MEWSSLYGSADVPIRARSGRLVLPRPQAVAAHQRNHQLIDKEDEQVSANDRSPADNANLAVYRTYAVVGFGETPRGHTAH
jgi:hypothetical protein